EGLLDLGLGDEAQLLLVDLGGDAHARVLDGITDGGEGELVAGRGLERERRCIGVGELSFAEGEDLAQLLDGRDDLLELREEALAGLGVGGALRAAGLGERAPDVADLACKAEAAVRLVPRDVLDVREERLEAVEPALEVDLPALDAQELA